MTVKAFLHRTLWQRLPQHYRRKALFAAAALLAPRPARGAGAGAGPVVVAGALRTASGLGESARLCLETLRAGGFDARGVDLGGVFMQPPDLADYAFPDGRGAIGPGVLILHVNAPLVPLALARLGRALVRGKRIIGYWAWELPEMAPDWRAGLGFVHEIWVPSRFAAAAIARQTDLPVHVIAHPVTVPRLPPAAAPGPARPHRAELTVLTLFNMASSFARKNPLAAVAAFRIAFGADPSRRLLIKLTNPSAYPPGMAELMKSIAGAPNITIMDKSTPSLENFRLIAESDILLSMHRSEGFGLILAEAMCYGRVVVATGWSGNMDFMTTENSCPVRYRLVPAHDPQGIYDHRDQLWADPDPFDAARHLRRLGDPAERVRLGARAARDIAALCARRHYLERMAERLGRPAAGGSPVAGHPGAGHAEAGPEAA